MPYKDAEKHKEWRKAYYAAHKEKASKDAVDWYHAHQEESAVKETRRAHSRQWKLTHHEQHLASRRRRYAERRDNPKPTKWDPLIARALAAGCTLCPAVDPRVLRFRHVDPSTKRFKVGDWRAMTPEAPVREEILKCMVVCANCNQRIRKGSLSFPAVPLDAYWRQRLL